MKTFWLRRKCQLFSTTTTTMNSIILFLFLSLSTIHAQKCQTNEQCETPDTGLSCQQTGSTVDQTSANTIDHKLVKTSTCLYCNVSWNNDPTTSPCGPQFTCQADVDTGIYKCKRAGLFSNQTNPVVWIGVVLLFIGSSLAAGGGLGGGGIFVPLLILIVGLSPKEAVPISQAMIFGGSIVNLFMNYRSRHPTVPTRPLIDYDAVLILEPLMLLGTTVGVVLNTVSPTWLIVVILVIVIGYGAIRTSKRGLRQFRKERNERIAKRKQSSVTTGDVEMIVVSAESDEVKEKQDDKDDADTAVTTVDTFMGKGILKKVRDESIGRTAMQEIELIKWTLANNAKVMMYTPATLLQKYKISVDKEPETPENKQLLASIIENEGKQNLRLLFVMGMLILIVVLSLIRGGKAGAASVVGIETCSGGYWAVTAVLFVILIILAVVVGKHLSKQHDQKMKCHYTFVEGDIMWTGRNVYMYPALSAFAGMCGGLLGIGGGMIMGPLLLELGMLPGNTQATSATTVMITSGAAMFQFLFLGKERKKSLLLFFVVIFTNVLFNFFSCLFFFLFSFSFFFLSFFLQVC